MAGSGLFHALLGAGAIMLLAPTLQPPAARSDEPAAPPATTASGGQQPIVGASTGTTLIRDADGHYYADALANGTPVRFLVDTGSSATVLTASDAQRLGLGSGDFSAKGRGVGGEVRLRPVLLQRLTLGTLASDNVPAMVAERGLPVSLLGQDWLSRVGTVTITDDRMMLR